jgi:hypothetical protein
MVAMSSYEPIGYRASLLVLATFCTRGVIALRAVAIASNVAFVVYGWLVGIDPVLVLHLVLLPTNSWRLVHRPFAQRSRQRRRLHP